MTEVKAQFVGGNLCFRNFIVKKESDSFYGVYEKSCLDNYPLGGLITSADSMNKAAKKAKLLQIGYNICRYYMC
jgi:hypothetical protein